MQARLFVPVFFAHKKSLDLCYKLAKLTTPVLAPFALPIQCSAAHRQDRNIPPAHTIFSDFIVIGCERDAEQINSQNQIKQVVLKTTYQNRAF